MGRLAVEEMREYLASDDEALVWHLTDNHNPPVTLKMLPICKAAINKANKGDWEWLIKLPDGITMIDGSYATAREIIDNYHLDGFLGGNDE